MRNFLGGDDSRLGNMTMSTRLVWFYFLLINCIPGVSFFFILDMPFLGRLALLLFNIGLFTTLLSLSNKIGRTIWWLFPLIFLHCFQIVLLFLFGNEPIGQDMFLNLITSNGREAGELMSSVSWVIVVVVVIYVPALVLGIVFWIKKKYLSYKFRLYAILAGVVLMVISFILPFLNTSTHEEGFTFRKSVYPINVVVNLYDAVRKVRKVDNYQKTSKGFSYQITKDERTALPKHIVLVIGETGRAENWELYGYPRETNPLLKTENNLFVFRDALTQSNVTHKSVPLFLSSAEATDYPEIYKRKGIFDAFRDAGYRTYFLSNEGDEFLINDLAKQADFYRTIRIKEDGHKEVNNFPDGTLFDLMTDEMLADTARTLIVFHIYGSHFNYTDRYPKDFSYFNPTNASGPYPKERPKLINSYDNSIRYTDYFLATLINKLKASNVPSALLYASDHGEDIFDDSRRRFLHSSTVPTYYQLRIPLFIWFSDAYESAFPRKVAGVKENIDKPVSTSNIFPTLLDLSFIGTRYSDTARSLSNEKFSAPARYFLDQYDEPEAISKMKLAPQDYEMFKKDGIRRD